MSRRVIDELLKANKRYADQFNLGGLPTPPSRQLAVVACMDARMSIEPMLGLETGEAHIIRNAGGLVTEDAIRSLVISHHLLGTQEFVVINHTGCGMLTFTDHELREQLRRKTGTDAVEPAGFHTFNDLEKNVQNQLQKIRSHPWIPDSVAIAGFVYDVSNGRLVEVKFR